jgi:RNA polymerase sigma factor (sigma-70 family)
MSEREAQEAQIRDFISGGNLRSAIEAAVVGYGDELLAYLLKELKDQEVTKDVFSRFIENICRGIHTFRMESSFRTWAYTILKNTLRRHLREGLQDEPPALIPAGAEISALRYAVAQDGSISVSMIPNGRPSASSDLQQKEQLLKLNELRQRLKKADRDLVSLVVDKEMSFEEIAEKLSSQGAGTITAEALRQRFHRAQEKLRNMLEEGA